MGFPDGEEDERHEARPVFFLRLRGRPESMRPVSLSGIPESLRPIRLKVSGFFFVSLSGKKTKEEKKG